jgi:hypothetical protein
MAASSMLVASSAFPDWLGLLLAAVGGVAGGFVVGAFGSAITWWARRARAARLRLRRVESSISQVDYDQHPDAMSPRAKVEAAANIARDPIRGPRLYCSDLKVSGFRCFERAELSLHFPGRPSGLAYPNVNLILGDNGTGKSTLLKAIAITALGPILDSSGFVPYRLIRETSERASITGRFLVDEPTTSAPGEPPREQIGTVELSRLGDYERISAMHDASAWRRLFDELDPSFLVVGYGVTRRTPADVVDRAWVEQSRRRRRYQRVASLFDESALLTPLSSWLPTLNHRRRAEVEELLAGLLPGDAEIADSTGPETIFQHRGVNVPYRALSDGYKSFIGWIADLLFQIDSVAQGELPFQEVGGIVLVDEVDLLLHPAWQRQVVPNLARALPELQFVFTSHSPIVAGTLESGNILVAREDESGGSRLVRLEASIHGLNAEQILLSSYFGLESTRAPGVQSELSGLARRAIDGDERAAHEYLRILAGKYGENGTDEELGAEGIE